MKNSHLFVSYLMLFFIVVANFEQVLGDGYPSYEGKQYEYHHHEYNPPPPKAKKGANIDINIPFDLGTIAKLGVLGLTQLKLLMALGKVATAGLGVGAIGLGQLGKIGLKVGSGHKGGGIAIDLGGAHEAKSHHHYEPVEKRYQVEPEEKRYEESYHDRHYREKHY